ncbi:MAG TPA: hypothetical protein VHY37_12830 [Tepidisphaeraceae bacterium]|jgi:hypothetical protein|nr:hypothetical protein [Tepidisphaeraceae bacterium]
MFKRFAVLSVLCVLAVPAFGVTTMYWTQTNPTDFSSGKLDGVVANNFGNLKLSRAVKTLFDENPHVSVVYALAQTTDGTIYAGTGPEGVLLAIKDGKTSTVLDLGGTGGMAAADAGQGDEQGGEKNIFSLCAEPNGNLLIGTGGAMGRVLELTPGSSKPKELFRNDAAQYVWAIVRSDDRKIYAATGPSGKIFEIDPNGASKVLLDTGENNVLCMIGDGKDTLYAGTSGHGLVYRINRKTGDSFILYNAAETDVQTLALDAKGNLYAGTAQAKDESQQQESSDTSTERNGHPEEAETGVPIAPQQPHNPPPAPAPAPNPNPGEPHPIPKTTGTSASPIIPVRPILGDDIRRVHIIKDLVVSPYENAGAHIVPADDDPGDGGGGGGGGDNPGPPHGPIPPVPGPQTQPANAGQQRPSEENPAPTGEPQPEGNAIYKIDPRGFVTEIFRQPVLVMGMIEYNGVLLVATGSNGQVYQVNPDAQETEVVAKVESKQVTCLLPAKDGNIYLGFANVGGVATMSSGYADKGTYTSSPLDASQISQFGQMQLHGTLPPGTALTVATRSGNVKEPIEKGWSAWSAETPAKQFLQVTSPSARFLEYRLTFTSNAGKSTPVVQDVSIAYQTPNLAPVVKAVKIVNPAAPDQSNGNAANGPANGGGDSDSGGGGGGNGGGGGPPAVRFPPTRHLTITWDSSDPNNDNLVYTLYFRLVGTSEWIVLKDKLSDTSYDWDTRMVADGRYEIKVLASDAPSNTPADAKTAARISDPVVVDNTPPVIGEITTTIAGATAHIDTTVADATSVVGEVDYTVDSAKDWRFVLPVSNIYDSAEARMSFDVPGLTPGKHQITLRATDTHGNQSFATVFVIIEPAHGAAK